MKTRAVKTVSGGAVRGPSGNRLPFHHSLDCPDH
jgi:hypothetical protein